MTSARILLKSGYKPFVCVRHSRYRGNTDKRFFFCRPIAIFPHPSEPTATHSYCPPQTCRATPRYTNTPSVAPRSTAPQSPAAVVPPQHLAYIPLARRQCYAPELVPLHRLILPFNPRTQENRQTNCVSLSRLRQGFESRWGYQRRLTNFVARRLLFN